MKYWSTVKTVKYSAVHYPITTTWHHTVRYGRQAISMFVCSNVAPDGAHRHIHKVGEKLVEITLVVNANKNEMRVRDL